MLLVELKESDLTEEQIALLTEDLGDIETLSIDEEIDRVNKLLESLNG